LPGRPRVACFVRFHRRCVGKNRSKQLQDRAAKTRTIELVKGGNPMADETSSDSGSIPNTTSAGDEDQGTPVSPPPDQGRGDSGSIPNTTGAGSDTGPGSE
jgi:hypothetical protein